MAKRFKNEIALNQQCPKHNRNHNTLEAGQKNSKRQDVITEKQLSRQKLILEFVKECKVVDDQVKIYRHVTDAELEMGSDYGKMDRKSFRKILTRLATDGKIKILRRVLE